MADRFPLILNTSANQIQEIASGDTLDLTDVNISNAGVITATSFAGDGSGLIGVASTDNIVTGTAATFNNTVDINSDLDVDGHTNLDNVSIAGVTTFSGIIEGTAGENKIPALYADLASLPSASTYHGMFAHVHSEGKGYFSHAGNWLELVNRDTNGNVSISGNVSDSKGNLRDIPQNSQGSGYSLVAADAGKHISITTGGVTIPASQFSAGDAITIINNSSNDQTITCSAVTTYLAGDTSSKSSLTLKGRGVATFLFASATVCYGSGAGLE